MKRMTPQFAVFNSHVNNASDRADAEYIAQLGQASWDEHIKPLHDAGIMSVFATKPTHEAFAWVILVTAYVNENRGEEGGDDGDDSDDS